MEEGRPQSEPHHLGSGVDGEDASFHLGEENTFVKQEYVHRRGQRHVAHVFRHCAWHLNALSMYKHSPILLLRLQF